MKKYFLIIGLIIICSNNIYSQNSNIYKVEINRELWKTQPIIARDYFDNKYLNDGNLHIYFESSFENDSAEIKINGKLYGEYALTTEWSTELADVIVIPKIETIKSVGISINHGKEAVFEIEKLNQIIVRFGNNKLLIGFRKHVPYYD
ncbi:hypothetical protein [uncultured Draconibacterium sp.]|uniref:hypothetical protein n=1 Tax=uncultured Draconibacterium sp. TaxID=1573823 RepID=UPI0029C920D0|nr:hypothetical protein [uncultured Draconibacterium sp.]